MTLSGKLKLFASMMLVIMALSGCMNIKNEFPVPSQAPELSFGPVTIDGRNKEVLRHFETNGRATYWFLYLIPKNKLNGYELARRELRQGEAVQNLKIVTKYDLVDFLCGFISLVFGTHRIEVSGDVVKA